MKNIYLTLIFLILLGTVNVNAQQDPQYTQYMYNTQVINPAYAGSREALSFGLLYRNQWVGLDGAPQSGTFSMNTPFGGMDNMGIGFAVVYDEIGPATESNIVVDYSYSINTSDEAKLSFGLKAGVDILDVDFTKLNIYDEFDPRFQENIDNKFQPQIGAGVYFNTNKFYIGLSVPNFLNSKHYDESNLTNPDIHTVAAERLHYFLISGYVFDLSENLKFKPATLVKAVSGSPLQVDVSANFLLYEKVTLGAAYRWSAAMSALVGFQVSDGIFIGFGYDYQTTELEDYSDGSYEVFLRFDILNRPEKVLTPRFF